MLTRFVLLVAVLAACKNNGSGDKASGNTGSAPGSASGVAANPSAPVAVDAGATNKYATTAAKLARYQECIGAFNAGKFEELGGCFGPASIREQVDSIPELVAEGPEKIVEMAKQQRASFPDLTLSPRLVVASGDTIAVLHHVSGKNTATGGMKATNKQLGIFEAEIVTFADDGTISRDSFYVDQPTVYHQLGLLPNDSSPGASKATGEPELLVATNDEREASNIALVRKLLDAVSKKDAKTIAALAAEDIKFVYHGEKQKVESKKAYMKWMRDTLASTDEGTVTVKDAWAAGDVVAVRDLFSGIPKGVNDDRQIKTNVVQFFRITEGKIVRHEMFANRLNTAVQLGLIDPNELMETLTAAAAK